MIDYKQKMHYLMELCAKHNASDLHLIVGRKPVLRIDGNLIPISREEILTPETTKNLVFSILDEEQKQKFLRYKDLDFSYSLEDKARFRIAIYFQRGFVSGSFRLIPSRIRTIEELNLPSVLHQFSKYSQGFVLVTGPAGHGKSTTLASILDEINHTRMDHIVTIEDPIEYLLVQDRSLIDQREVGTDTLSFHRALRSVLRQDPDVIMVGEMRDLETMSAAVTAAETGHLVLSTLHTNSASQTLHRIIDSFPVGQQNQIRSQLASTLVGIVSQRLIPQIEGGRVPACEVMFANSAIRNLIREQKIYQIDLIIETSFEEGMISLNRSLADLVKKEKISLEQAEFYSLSPQDLRLLLKE